MSDYYPWLACVLGTCLLVGCTKSSNAPEVLIPDQTQATSQRLKIEQRQVLFTGEHLTAFDSRDDDRTAYIEEFSQYLHQQGGLHRTIQALRQKLKLTPTQLLVLGNNQNSISKEFSLMEFPLNNLFANANDLTINHIRMLKTAPILEKGEVESTVQYQQRIKTQQEAIKLLTRHMQVDLGRVEDALNFLAGNVRISVNKELEGNLIAYDADSQTMQMVVAQTIYQSEDNIIRALTLSFKIKPDAAEQLLDDLRNAMDTQYSLGFIFNFRDGYLALNKMLIYRTNPLSFPGDEQIVALFAPEHMQLLQYAMERGEKTGDATLLYDFPINQLLPFQFGLENYGKRISMQNRYVRETIEPVQSEPEELGADPVNSELPEQEEESYL